jgi:hypothetical protein
LEVAHPLLGAEEARQRAGTRDDQGMVSTDRDRDGARIQDRVDRPLDGLVRSGQVAHDDRRVAAVDEVVRLEQIDVPVE